MYAIIYFNFSGNKEEFKEAKETLENVAKNFDGMELMDILIPSSEWNYAALLKFKNFETFTKYIKKTRVDGLIINQLTDCHLNSKCYDILKNKIRTELRIPSIGIKFKKIGENIEQVKAKLGPFMELFS